MTFIVSGCFDGLNFIYSGRVPLSGISYSVVYIESKAFTKRLHQLAGASALEVLSGIQADLLKNPACGDLVQGLGGIRKARCANPARSKGKRGGYRYLFLYLENRDHIHLLYRLIRTNKKIYPMRKAKRCGLW